MPELLHLHEPYHLPQVQASLREPSAVQLEAGQSLRQEFDHRESSFFTEEDRPVAANGNKTAFQISSIFHLNTTLDRANPDLLIATDDNAIFAVHSHRLAASSMNYFGGLLLPHTPGTQAEMTMRTLVVTEDSAVFNVVLCTAYDISCSTYSPSFECIAAAISAMKKYAMTPLHSFISRGKPLYDTILDRAPLRPLDTYALAGAENLEELAVACSPYTLPFKLHLMPDETAVKMGAAYLHRLHRLHGMRMDALKDMLDASIFPHVARSHCSIDQRRVVNRAYSLAAAQVLQNASPSLSAAGIEYIMTDLVESVSCPDCKDALRTHVKGVVMKWLLLKRTI